MFSLMLVQGTGSGLGFAMVRMVRYLGTGDARASEDQRSVWRLLRNSHA